MYQRLLLLLAVVFIGGAGKAQNVMTPADGDYIYDSLAVPGTLNNPIPAGAGIMQKWVHDTVQKATPVILDGPLKNFRITWDQSNYKSYRWGNLSFRLRFPNNYNPATKYPAVVFMHGQGEASEISNVRNNSSTNRENQDQLYWGAQSFEQRINAGEWNGFLLFPQLMVDSNNQGGIWNESTIPPINNILDTLEKYNGLDPDRVVAMGLSAGGFGCVNYANLFPQRIAGVISSSPRFIQDINATIDAFLQVPVWVATGGLDVLPDPPTTMNTRNIFNQKGGNLYMSYYGTKGHDTWLSQWAQSDAYKKSIMVSYWNLHKAQPLLYFQNNQFCEGQPVSAKMGLTPGFFAYEWQFDNGGGFATIPGASANVYTATQAGSYRARFKRLSGSNWSEWSPTPIVISTKKCSTDTLFIENFEKTPVDVYSVFGGGGTSSSYNYQNFGCQNGVFTNASEAFTQDATGRQGGKFLLHNTSDGNGCAYHVGDQVWRPVNAVTVLPNTDYQLNFYVGNENTSPVANPVAPLATLSATINDVLLTPANVQAVLAGNVSWKKYSFVWNSGNNTSAQPAILNNIASSDGNNFVLDEISLIKYKAPVMPGAAFKNVTLWAKANSITAPNSSPVGMWSNDDVNGNSLQQNSTGLLPLYKNNAADNINFNPVVALNTTTQTFMKVPGGFSGNTSHTAAHVFMVARFNNIGQNVNIIAEGTAAGASDSIRISYPGIVTWKAGNAGNTLVTADNINEPNKTIQWTFSKDNANTGSGNKQDIRKNGIVVASGNASSSFTGNNSDLRLGTFDGNLAEMIYILDSQITPLKQNQIESYLALKYGTTLGNGTTPVNYTASDATVFWTGSNTYQNDVFGIGTDSASGLVQTRSNSMNTGSGAGTGQSQKGNLVLATNTSLADRRFLMIGNDAAALTQTVIAPGQAASIAVGSTRINRAWKVANTGGVGAVDLSFDTTGLGSQAGGAIANNYALMIDNDGDGNFNTGVLSFYTATGGTGKKVNFAGTALNNNVVFTIVTLKSSSLLPALWLGFTATASGSNAVLAWKTSDEMNVDRYSVEHSFNGVSFSAVAAVTANNNTGVNEYGFTHTNLAAGMHYYRIRRIDKDGRSEYTDIKSVKIAAAAADVQVRPNPVTGAVLVLAVSVQQSSKTTLQVMGVDGKIVLQQSIVLAAGKNMVNLNIATVPAGIYLVQVKMSDEVITKKFIRQQ